MGDNCFSSPSLSCLHYRSRALGQSAVDRDVSLHSVPHLSTLLVAGQAGTLKSTYGFNVGNPFNNPAATQDRPGAMRPAALLLKMLPEPTNAMIVHFKKETFGKGPFYRLPQHCAALATAAGLLSQPKAGREMQDPWPPMGPPPWNTTEQWPTITACRLYKTVMKIRMKKRVLHSMILHQPNKTVVRWRGKKKKKQGTETAGREKNLSEEMQCQKLFQDPVAGCQLKSLQKKWGYRALRTSWLEKNLGRLRFVKLCLLCPLSPRRSQPEIGLWRGDPRHPGTLASYPLGNMCLLRHLCILESF